MYKYVYMYIHTHVIYHYVSLLNVQMIYFELFCHDFCHDLRPYRVLGVLLHNDMSSDRVSEARRAEPIVSAVPAAVCHFQKDWESIV